ncbi:MAG: hypothetical protein R6X13_02885, partial [bacterium]
LGSDLEPQAASQHRERDQRGGQPRADRTSPQKGAPVNHTPSGRRSYSYTANASGIAEGPAAARGRAGEQTICRAADLRVHPAEQAFSADGRVVRSSGELKPGVYWLRTGEETRRVVLVP